MKFWKEVTVCLLFWFLQLSVLAQSKINFACINVKDGLPSNTVYTINKDRFGFMWFGTTNGLARFDGTNFIVYRHDASKVNTLPTNEVLSTYEDRFGKLWIGTSAGGVSFYDRVMGRIIPYKGDGSWPNMDRVSPRAILQDYHDNLWIGTYGDLRYFNLKTGHATTIRFQNVLKDRAAIVILYLFEDSRRRMWIGTNRGLFYYNEHERCAYKFVNNPADPGSLSKDVIKCITEDKDGSLWIATYGGLNRLSRDGRIKLYKHDSRLWNSISSDDVFTLNFDDKGKIWIGTDEGLNIFDTRSESFQIIQPDDRNPFSLKSKSIRSMYIDRKGIYWIGTLGGGLAKYNENLPLFNLKQCNPYDQWGLRSPIVTSFVQSKDGLIFVGTDGAGIERFNNKTGLFKPVDLKSRLDKTGSKITIMKLYIDHEGFLWAGTYHHGIFRIDVQNGRYEQFISTSNAKGLNNNDVTSFAEDGYGNLWIGTLGGGLNIYSFKDRSIEQFNNKAINRVSPLNEFISSIIRTPDGKMWVASVGTGAAAFDPISKMAIRYTKENNRLPVDAINYLFFDHEGTLWLATDAGICALNLKTQQAITYTEKDGLPSAIVQAIVEDNSGILWISTDRGISSFDKRTKTFRNFNAENGVQQSTFTEGAVMRADNGDIYLGGRDGFNFFNPNDLPHGHNPGQVILTDLKVSNESITPGENSPIKEQIGTAKTITLRYGLNFSIAYVAVDYTAPKQNLFAYRLAGFDKVWNYVRKGRVANYTNLDPGKYVFEVKASSDGTNWSEHPAEVSIIILPPFWRTGYAYFFYVLFAVLSILYLRQRGIRKIRREFEIQQDKRQVEQLMQQERREAEQLHQLDLLKIKFLTDLSHEFRTPISMILAPVEKLLERKLIPEVQEDIKMINRNVRRLLNMVNQLLDFRKMEEEELHLHLQPGDIIQFIKDTCDSFKDVAARKGIIFIIESELESWTNDFDHNKLERIIFNLLSNAFKFTPAGGSVTLAINITGDKEAGFMLTIKVSDTGIGIPEEDLVRIFDRFYQHKTNEVLNQGTGIGLAITKEFVELHGGHIHAERTVTGACFVVDLPISPSRSVLSPTQDMTLPLIETPNETDSRSTEEEVSSGNLKLGEVLSNEKKATVLLVEDNDEFRSYLADHLRQYYHIVEAGDGKEGWQKTLSVHPQLVVSDINMPVMSGVELSRKIRDDKRTCHTPVILLTAMTGEEDQLAGLESGASDYLSKPFNFQILKTKIGNLLDLKKSVKDTYSKQIQLIGQEVVTESANLRLLNTIMKYIESKLSDSNLSVEELSKHVGMSRGSLYYKLIELTGQSPIEYIRSVKLEKAAALLENSELNVAQVAYITGFGTPSYFSRMFKVKYGIVPSEYLTSKRQPARIVEVRID